MKKTILNVTNLFGVTRRLLLIRNRFKLLPLYGFVIEPMFNLRSYIAARKNVLVDPDRIYVFLFSSMRSGSTLLKALMAENDSVSNLPEIYFYKYVNRWLFEDYVNKLSDKIVLLMKHPAQYQDYTSYPLVPSSSKGKSIVLYRGSVDTILSIEKMNQKNGESMGIEQLIDYWCTTYERLYAFYEARPENVFIIRYERLVEDPVGSTEELFKFIGLAHAEGVGSYSLPNNYNWGWGSDDGGSVIRGLSVVNNFKRYDSDKMATITKIVNDDRVKSVEKMYNALISGEL